MKVGKVETQRTKVNMLGARRCGRMMFSLRYLKPNTATTSTHSSTSGMPSRREWQDGKSATESNTQIERAIKCPKCLGNAMYTPAEIVETSSRK